MAKPSGDDLAVQRTRHLLQDIAEGPFVAVIFDGDDLRIYTAGLDADKLALIETLVESLTKPTNEE